LPNWWLFILIKTVTYIAAVCFFTINVVNRSRLIDNSLIFLNCLLGIVVLWNLYLYLRIILK
jgi:hypothetical protein